MLKPKRKITRKEIKRDPFLETIETLENSFDKNKKTFLNVALGLIVAVIFINFFLKKQDQKNIDSNSSLGVAMVAFNNKDYENAKFQFETILKDFDGTIASNIANFFMGRIYFENNDFEKSASYLDTYMSAGKPKILKIGALKMSTHIAMQKDQYDKALNLLDNASRKMSKYEVLELKLIKAEVLKHQGEINKSTILLNELRSEKNIPRYVKQRSEEFLGMM